MKHVEQGDKPDGAGFHILPGEGRKGLSADGILTKPPDARQVPPRPRLHDEANGIEGAREVARCDVVRANHGADWDVADKCVPSARRRGVS